MCVRFDSLPTWRTCRLRPTSFCRVLKFVDIPDVILQFDRGSSPPIEASVSVLWMGNPDTITASPLDVIAGWNGRGETLDSTGQHDRSLGASNLRVEAMGGNPRR
jgi:hypothetical protein